jgi:hypothetical protein
LGIFADLIQENPEQCCRYEEPIKMGIHAK